MYRYEDEKPRVLTPEGQRMLLEVLDKMDHLMDTAGAATMDKIISGLSGGSWLHMACVDYLVELGRYMEVPQSIPSSSYRLFVR